MLKKLIEIYKRIHFNILNKSLEEKSKNITLFRQNQALKETVEFINSNMEYAPAFQNKFQLISHAIAELSSYKGLIIEFGVFQGKTINYIAKLLPNHQIFGFASFEGLPEPWNTLKKGAFKVKRIPKVRSNIILKKGWFNETIPVFKKTISGNISLLHIDCDLYSSAKLIFEELGNNIDKDTIVIFDEFFNFPSWKNGEYKAFMEFVQKQHKNFEYIGYCFRGEQVAVKIL